MIGSLASALFFGWRHYELTESKSAPGARAQEISTETAVTKSGSANINNGSPSAQPVAATRGSASFPATTSSVPTSTIPEATASTAQPTKENWVLEKNRNWHSSLANGAYDNHRAVTTSNTTTTVYVVPQTSTTFVPLRSVMPPPVRPPVVNRPPPGSAGAQPPVRPAGAPPSVPPRRARPSGPVSPPPAGN